MLAKGVVGEQDVVARQIGRHTVRPMQHLHFDENQCFSVSDVNRITGLDDIEVPFRMMILSRQRFDRACGAVYGYIRYFLHQCGQRAAMVDLSVIDHEKIDLV